MKKIKYLFSLLFLVFMIFTTCKNSIMEKWWDENDNIQVIGSDLFATVVFDSDGGVPQPRAIKLAYGVVIGRLKPMTKDGFGFAGWFDEKGNLWNTETQPVSKEDDADGDGILLLTARWVSTSDSNVSVFEITFDPDGAYSNSFIPPQLIAQGGKIVQPVLPKPRIENSYGFDGWYDENGTLWNFDNVVSRNITLKAKWHSDFCIVRFEPNGGTRPDNLTILTHEFAVSTSANYGIVPDPGPLTRGEDYVFGGWYTEGFTEKWDFVTGRVTSSYPPYNPPNPQVLTLFARWIPVYRTLIFEQNGGSGLAQTIFKVKIGLRLLDPPNPGNPGGNSRTGFMPGGWYFDPTFAAGTNLIIMDWVVPEPEILTELEPIYLYQKWIREKDPVEFFIISTTDDPLKIPPSGTGQQDLQLVEYGNLVQKPSLKETPPAGFYFNGIWYKDSDCTPGQEWNFDSDRITGARTLYGKYQTEPPGITIKFVLGTPPGGLHSVYTHQDVTDKLADQKVYINGLVHEPFMPPLPDPGINNNHPANTLSFYCWSLDPINSGGVNPETVRAFDFSKPLTETDVLTYPGYDAATRTLTLYARWIEQIPDMVWVPRGSFIMGDPSISGSPAAYHAYPTRRVSLDGYYISRYMVTQTHGYPLTETGKGYTAVTGKPNPSQFTAIDARPVENVSWYDAMEYCRILNGGIVTEWNYATNSWSNPNGYRLPTEAEWEYAARGGYHWQDNFAYAGSNDPTKVAWYNITVKEQISGQQSTQVVGTKDPNQLGIYDMSGNLSEWCYDWFAPYNTLTGDGPNGTGPNPIGATGPFSNANATGRVRRGGAWNNAAGNVRVAVRNSETPTAAHWAVGFRVVRGPVRVF